MLLQLFHENREGGKEAESASSSFSLCFWDGAIQGMASPALSSSPESWGCTGGGTGGVQAAVSSSREPGGKSSHWRWLGWRLLTWAVGLVWGSRCCPCPTLGLGWPWRGGQSLPHPPGVHEHQSRGCWADEVTEADVGSYGMEILACPTKVVPSQG